MAAAYVKQTKAGLHNGVWNVWDEISERLTRYMGPLSSYIKAIIRTGWRPVGPCIDNGHEVSHVASYGGFVEDRVRAALLGSGRRPRVEGPTIVVL